MPATEDLPTVETLRTAFHTEVRGVKRYRDDHLGARLDHWAGVGAMTLARVSAWERDNFRRIFFDSATGEPLDAIVEDRYQRVRQELTRATGSAILTRPSAAAGAGTVWKGTRIGVSRGGTDPLRRYRVTDNVSCLASLTRLEVPLEAEQAGTGQDVTDDQSVQTLMDPLWDATWTVDEVRATGGLDREGPEELRGRVRDEMWAARLGYPEAIEQACRDAGAGQVVLFQSDWLGTAWDFGLNRVYVGDAGFTASAALLRDCRLAVADVGIEGMGLQVLPMAETLITIDLTITLWQEPDRIDQGQAKRLAADATLEYFRTRENPFVWRTAGIRAAVQNAVRGTQTVAVAASVAEPTLATLFQSEPLPRYALASSGSVQVALEGPS
jgi:hypothetical protein